MGNSHFWDERKYAKVRDERGIAFEDVIPMFESGNHTVEISDDSTLEEERLKATGYAPKIGAVVVVYVEEPDNVITIISAWRKE